ncbi:MAG: GTPase Era [Nitrospinae bacterium CG11_big_fil_rev_8_21_14_0_20_45_15]|nr:MAG: GTPase Era [Nitrospinae bacterium CG11_big_fil_rev_8_21_14_0_20_45_15]
MNKEDKFKSGYISLIGKPNVGKSTLLNQLVDAKLAAITSKPQTTRTKITGIAHLEGGQIIILDTPGIHKAHSKLNKMMVQTALRTFSDVDLILFLIDGTEGFSEDDDYALALLEKISAPVFLIVNKIDRIPKPQLLELMGNSLTKRNFAEIIPISALKNDGVDVLEQTVLKYFSEGPQYFPDDMITDCPDEFWVSEIVREKIMKLTQLEIPYSSAVLTDRIKESKPGVLVIDSTIYVEKRTQKMIVVGEKGRLIKQIGQLARKEIEKRFGCSVYLKLFVKVKNGWSQSSIDLQELGYTHDPH